MNQEVLANLLFCMLRFCCTNQVVDYKGARTLEALKDFVDGKEENASEVATNKKNFPDLELYALCAWVCPSIIHTFLFLTPNYYTKYTL